MTPMDYGSFFGGGGGPSAFSSSGMNPMMLAMLSRMGSGIAPAPMAGGQPLASAAGAAPGMTAPGPAIPGVPQLAQGVGAPMLNGTGAQPQQSNPMDMLSRLQNLDPTKIRQMLGMFGLGAKPAVPMPSNGVSNNYYNAGDAMALGYGG